MSSPSDSGVSFVNLSAWQLENLSSPPAASSPESIRFIVEIRVNRRHQWVYNDETAGLSVMDDIMAPMKRQFFTLESCYLMGDNPHWYIYMMLSQMRVPLQHISEIIPDMISYLNHALISNSMGIPRLILSIVFSVDITKLIPYEEDEPVVELQPNDNVDDDEDDEDEDDDEPVFYPKKSASKSSIDSLKVMTFTGEGSGGGSDTCLDSCRVCLEEFKVGMEVKCMPCNHLFHGDCITGWLKVRNFCPLCRHPMPSDKEETASSSSTSDMPAGRNPEV